MADNESTSSSQKSSSRLEIQDAETNAGASTVKREDIIRIVCGIILFVFCCIIALVFLFKSVSQHTKANKTNKSIICQSNTCTSTANFILKGLNKSVNPCENFHEFVCGNENDMNRVEKNSVNTKIEKSLITLVDKISEKSPEYLKKLRKYHESCVEFNVSLENLTEKLCEIYSWPILNKSKHWTEIGSDWIEFIPKLFNIGFEANYFLSVSIIRDSRNNSRNILRLDEPFLNVVKEDINSKELQEYKKVMLETFRQIGIKDDIQAEINEIIEFETTLTKISLPRKSINHMLIRDLQAKYSKIQWKTFLNRILSSYVKIDTSEEIYVAEPFIEKFYDLMTNRKPSNRILANYVLWRLLQSVRNEYLSSVQSRNNSETDESYEHRRKLECMQEINENMYLATSALYLKNNGIDKAVSVVKNMAENIRNILNQMIQKNDWLTEDVKKETLENISKIHSLIRYPIELLNDTKLNAYYKDLNISSENYILNALNYKKFYLKNMFESLKKPIDVLEWTGDIGRVARTDVKFSSYNIVYLPGGILQQPFYYENVPNYINYAKIGFVLGHKMIHSLSAISRIFDGNNYSRDNHSDSMRSDINLNRTNCTVERNNTVNSTVTLDENVADILGLKLSYKAYMDNVKNDTEPLLPGLENYTYKQLFWITFGTSLCLKDKSLLSLTNESSVTRAPKRYRINGIVSGLKEFAKDFNCQPTDAMNHPEKCSLWS